MMRRITAILTALALLLVLFGGCGRSPGGGDFEEESAPELWPEEQDGEAPDDGPEKRKDRENADDEAEEPGRADGPSPLEGLVIGLVYSRQDDWSAVQLDDIQRAAEERGCELHWSDARGDVAEHIAQVEDLVSQGVDIVVISVLDGNALIPVIEVCFDAGVLVAVIDRPLGDGILDDWVSSVAPSNHTEGALCALLLAEYSFPKAVVEISPYVDLAAANERREGMMEALGETRLLILEGGGSNSLAEAMALMEDGVRLLVDEAIEWDEFGVLAHGDSMAEGAVEALRAAGYPLANEGGAPVVVAGAQRASLEMLARGEIAGAVLRDPFVGDALLDELERRVLGEPARQIEQELLVVTAANLQDFERRVAGWR